MTQQEALKELEDLTIDYGKRTEEEIERLDEAVDMAIAALRADTVDSPTCEDAVSRVDVLETYADLYQVFEDSKGICKELHKVYDRINALPAVQSQPEEDCDTCKHGYFGSRQCDNCRVRYPSHYEREEEHHGSD